MRRMKVLRHELSLFMSDLHKELRQRKSSTPFYRRRNWGSAPFTYPASKQWSQDLTCTYCRPCFFQELPWMTECLFWEAPGSFPCPTWHTGHGLELSSLFTITFYYFFYFSFFFYFFFFFLHYNFLKQRFLQFPPVKAACSGRKFMSFGDRLN